LGLVAATVGGVLGLAWVMRRRRRRRVGLAVASCAAVLASPLGVWLLAPVIGSRPATWAEDWRVAACDVGQGTAVAIRAGPSSAVLIDTGPPGGQIGQCLNSLGVERVDGLILTHLHQDHAGGVDEVTGRGLPGIILAPIACGLPAREGDLSELSDRTKVALVASSGQPGPRTRVTVGEAVVEVYASPLDRRCRHAARTDSASGEDGLVNDASLAIHATVPGVDLWVLGDLELAGQAALARSIEDSPAGAVARGVGAGGSGTTTVVVVAHHGSAKQDRGLAHLLASDVAIFSAGEGNDYGHPADTALSLYGEVSAVIGRTDTDGHLAVRTDGSLVGSLRKG
jgi:competence protein ComEC